MADTAAINPNDPKTLLVGIHIHANGVNTFFINGKRSDNNGLRKLRNGPFWLIIMLVVPFNKILLFYKDLITFIISFIWYC